MGQKAHPYGLRVGHQAPESALVYKKTPCVFGKDLKIRKYLSKTGVGRSSSVRSTGPRVGFGFVRGPQSPASLSVAAAGSTNQGSLAEITKE